MQRDLECCRYQDITVNLGASPGLPNTASKSTFSHKLCLERTSELQDSKFLTRRDSLQGYSLQLPCFKRTWYFQSSIIPIVASCVTRLILLEAKSKISKVRKYPKNVEAYLNCAHNSFGVSKSNLGDSKSTKKLLLQASRTAFTRIPRMEPVASLN